MMSMLKNLALLSMVLLIYSCNEKISPALEGGGITTLPPPVVPKKYFFKVEDTSPTILNYKLHRTGPGKQSAKCEITSNSLTTGALSSDLYVSEHGQLWDEKKFDISCFFEAEELSLYYSGFQFKVSASPNTCAHVGYAPFSFYDNIPGNSSATYTYVNCSDDVPVGQAASKADIAGDTDYGVGGLADCGEYVDTTISSATRNVRSGAPEGLCDFNYNEDKCDEGVITINDIDVKWVVGEPKDPPVQDNPVTTTVDESVKPPYTSAKLNPASRTISCGGDHLNCVKGPIKDLESVYAASSTELNASIYNEVFSKEFTYEASYPEFRGNKRYVNYRRNLANPNIDFGDSDQNLVTYSTNYISQFGGAAPETSFQPLLMDLYSYNLKWGGVYEVVSTTDPSTTVGSLNHQSIINGYTARPYAAEPYLGFGDHRVNPFYTFYCFDEAYEIKGRIRMMVREWDRVFPTAITSLSYISDIGSLTSSRQDYAYGQTSENPGDPDGYNAYNDLKDWDDYLFMKRDAGAVTTSTLWEPKSGFFNSLIFTKGGL